MNEAAVFFLTHDLARLRAMAAVAEAPEGWQIKMQPPTRSLDQSAKFHAICGDLARAGVQWMGKPRTGAQWKVLLVSGHAVATKEGAELVPGLEGEFVNLRESTATMSKKRSASLIEYAQAFAAQQMEKQA